MTSLLRNKRDLYLCKAYIENNITKYKEPELINTNYQPTNSDGEIIALGLEYSEYLRIKDNISIGQKFNNGDKCYVFVKPPAEHDALCKNADFIVSGEPLLTLNEGEVTLKRLTGKKS